MDLDALILLVFLLLKKVLSASSYGQFTEAKEFWSQCRIFRWRMSKSLGPEQNSPTCSPTFSHYNFDQNPYQFVDFFALEGRRP